MSQRSTRPPGTHNTPSFTPWRRDRTLATSLMMLALLCAIELLTGCASRPPVSTPESTANSTAPVLDIDKAHTKALQHMQAGEWDAAHELLAGITGQDPSLSGAWTNLGITRVQRGDREGAEAAFKSAIDANDHALEAYNQLGMLYRRHGRLDEAEFIYSEALKRDADYANLHWNLAILYDRYLPNPHLALKHYRRYQALSGAGDAQLQAWIIELEAPDSGDGMTARVQP